MGASMNDVKEHLGRVARERGWNGVDGEITKAVYFLIGKKTLKIDRRGKAGGIIGF